ncbi:O-antigen ligase family protein [Pectobacterium parmentieri]|uniref:O-antigen ligase family protein n=1 Tax=Pectobacterium parmentieri TaxID=1905730 RepID=UPI000EB578D7|nr:O-antigen ligase family protein [Pectobacterium parmentieri]AYH02182.1 hypothetical protein C5E26_15205 [Pectobacterium parmentieri]AYH11001.1 hypothetical protein C5E24_15550 [Pectobacterium parmentieri]AYH18284.1 hypothetical protein C5E22_07235 [Pectobacterium parmentieri]AYH28448.1 hypothetical protein C5E20_15605 [Pectobacterium parmentieri]MBI0471870.1 O-antigen ligase family protein [Pectobacterium parmentieri]
MPLYNKAMFVCLFLFVLSYLTNAFSIYPFSFFNVEELQVGTQLRINHLMFFPLFFVSILAARFISRKHFIIFAFLFFFTAYGLFLNLIWWPDFYFLNYLWASICFLIADVYIRKGFDAKDITKIISSAALFFFIFVSVKNIIYFHEFISFIQNPTVHPLVPSLIGGGLNIEATMLGMLSLFFYDKKARYYFFLAIALVFSVFYSSRVGVISVVLSLLFFLYYYSINKFVFFIKVTFVILMIIILFSYLYYNGFYIVERFLQSGDVTEAGSSGRLNMWRWIMPAIVNNPFGYGIGNAVESVKFISGDDRFMDNNIHLYPMQVLLDFGILGFSFYLFALFYFIKKIFSVRGESLIYYSFIMIYFILGAVQFKGGETLIYLVAGFALSIERAES